MLEKFKSISKFKHSFFALIGISAATIINLIFNFESNVIFSIITFLFISSIVLTYLAKYKVLISFCCLFSVGLFSSWYYNSFNRVQTLPDNFFEHSAWVKGTISDIKINKSYSKIYLTDVDIFSDLFSQNPKNTPKQIIISTFNSRITDSKIGDTFVAKALLQKPSGKLFKDDFDYNKYLLQNNINLTGQVRGSLYYTPPAEGYSLLEKIMNYRLHLIRNINIPYSDINGVATALITGNKGSIPQETKEDYQKSGLAHLMTISGMHMTFLFGLIFLVTRYLICFSETIALNYSSKKIACFVALIFSLIYMILAGMNLPTVRAFLMILIFCITIFINRIKIALHSLCLIAIGIIAFDPIAIFSASFQLSFAAVFAILIYHQAQEDKLIVDFSRKGKLIRKSFALLNISIIAFCATMFFIASYFGYISIFAVFANILASLLMTFIVMPSLILYFIGFEIFNISIFQSLNNISISLLNDIAHYFANFETNSIYISEEYSFVLLLASLFIITIISFNISRKYLISLAILSIAFIIPVKLDLRPKILEINSQNVVAVRKNDSISFIGNISKRDKRKVLKFYRLSEISNNLPKTCDISGCIYEAYNKKILQINEGFSETNEDYNLADYVVN